MKRINWIKLTGINVLFILIILLPFLPGPSNNLVIALSIFGQSAGFFGLLLAPVGMIWILAEARERNREAPDWRTSYYLAISTLVIITAICLILVIAAFVNFGIIAGLPGLIPIAFGLQRAVRELKKLRDNAQRRWNSIPFYLLTIPLIAFVSRVYLVAPLSDYSRDFAIQRSQRLITSIEDYKIKEGQYPESIKDLEARHLKTISSPFIMGIRPFRYNKINDHYSISFSQWLELGSLEEIVLYDKNDIRNNLEGPYAIYDYKFDLCRVQGASASHDTGYDHWRYYLVD
ncbi:MAG: hypothetical protein WKF97_12060 [Chitinophagaceae bacterium]